MDTPCANFGGTYVDKPSASSFMTKRVPGTRGTNNCDRYEHSPVFSQRVNLRISYCNQMFAGLGRLVANKFLRFPRGTILSSYTQLYVAFFLSGLLHFGGDFMIEKQMVYRSFKFFLLQAVAITFEDFVIYLAKCFLRWKGIEFKPGKPDESWTEAGVRVIGYCWVTLWFCSTLPVWIDELNAIGLGSHDRGPITQFVLDTCKRRA